MRNLTKLAVIGTVVALVSGCAPKTPETGAYPKKDATMSEEYNIWAKKPSWDFLTSKATHLNETIAYTLQVSAEQTLSHNHKYFAIMTPELLSNTSGVLTNTAPEYLEKCATNNVAKGLFILSNPCKIASGNINDPTGGIMSIRMYDTPPNDVMVYNADEVLAGLKTNGFYQNAKN